MPTLEGRIALRDVGFRYPGPVAVPILADISLDVEPGSTVAIVGRCGSGKSTLIKCLAGLLEPTDGSINYDGLELRKLDYRQLRRRIGFVLQQTYLFDDTIASQHRVRQESPDTERVTLGRRRSRTRPTSSSGSRSATRRAIGDSGCGCPAARSSGSRSRARSTHQPPVLIFDEATSALDTESERAVQANMDRLLKGRTSFVIAHRLSTSATPTSSACSNAGASSNAAPTRS